MLAFSPAQPVHAKTCLSSGKAADGLTPGAYGPVREDGTALRTPLADFFNVPIKKFRPFWSVPYKE